MEPTGHFGHLVGDLLGMRNLAQAKPDGSDTLDPGAGRLATLPIQAAYRQTRLAPPSFHPPVGRVGV